MAFSPNEFTQDISKFNGVARQKDFDMSITLPRALLETQTPSVSGTTISGVNRVYPKLKSQLTDIGYDAGTVGRFLSFRIDSAEFPGRSINNNAIHRDYGVLRKIGIESNFVDVSCSLLLSANLRERVFFEIWQDMIVGNYRSERIGQDNEATRAFNVGYYFDYVADITINQYTIDEGKAVKAYTCTLKEAYPVLVSPLAVSWASDEVMRCTVSFAYRYFTDKVHYNKTSSAQPASASWLNRTGVGAGLATGAGVIASKLPPKAVQLAAGGVALAPQIFKGISNVNI